MAVIEKFIESAVLGSGVGGKRAIIKRSNGEFWVVYFKDASLVPQIRNTLAYTIDNGDTWGIISLSGGSSAAGTIGICVDTLDNIFAFYMVGSGLYYKIVPGGSYTPGTEKAGPISQVRRTNPITDSNDTIHFIVVDYGAIGHDLKQKYKVSGYDTWTSDTIESATSNYGIWATVDSNNNLHILYVKGYPGYYGLTYRLGLNNPPYHTKTWQTPEIIDTSINVNHWGDVSFCLDINESPIITSDTHGYIYRSEGSWYIESIGSFTKGNISSSRDSSLNVVAYVPTDLMYKYKNGSWSDWNLMVATPGDYSNAILWDIFPKIAGISNNIPFRGSVVIVRKTDGMYFYLVDTLWKYPSGGGGWFIF